jgi:hypothetical protein
VNARFKETRGISIEDGAAAAKGGPLASLARRSRLRRFNAAALSALHLSGQMPDTGTNDGFTTRRTKHLMI